MELTYLLIEVGIVIAALIFFIYKVALYRTDVQHLIWKVEEGVTKKWNGEIELKYEDQRFVRQKVEEILNENREEILNSYGMHIENTFKGVRNDYVRESVKNALENASKTLTQKATDAYIAEYLPEIMSNIDIKSVSNSLLLKVTGQILNQNTNNDEDNQLYINGGTN